LGSDITVITDCTAITQINTIKDTSNPRLVRWAIELAEYRLKLVYRSGKTNVVADFISRYPPQEVGNICAVKDCSLIPWIHKQILKQEQERDPDISYLMKSLNEPPLTDSMFLIVNISWIMTE